VEEPLPKTYLLLDVIRSDSENRQPISCGSDAVIAGGDKLALDAAKICIKNGAEKVTLLLRETLEAAPLTDADMASLESNHINVVFNAAIGRLFGVGNTLTELEYVDLESSSTVRIPADSLILASGRFPELILTRSEIEEIDEPEGAALQWEATIPYKRPDQLEEIGLLSEGDELSDYSAAIKAIAAGRRAAASIHQIMYGIPLILPENIVTPESIVQNVDHVENVQACARHIMPLGNKNELEAGGDLEKGFSREMARAEAARCLQCGLICYEHSGPTDNLNLSAAAN
jgi:NADPH-dependent glutamate synthase beta subunit-like oxidoreductase